MMHKTLNQLLKIQIIIAVVISLLTFFLFNTVMAQSVFSGAGLCVVNTLMAKRIFKRLPRAVSPKGFFQTMMTFEIMKWLIVALLGALLIWSMQPMGVIIGFALTYFSYFLMVLRM